MSYQVRKKISVEYAHQLFSSYTALCHESIHGHSGKIELYFQSNTIDGDKLNPDQMVIDFGLISDTIKKDIMEKFDHALFMPSSFDVAYLNMLKKYNKRLTITPVNPTAEYFAKLIFDMVEEKLKTLTTAIRLLKVRFHETDTGYAEYYNTIK